MNLFTLIDQIKTKEITSSLGLLEDFKKTTIWRDMNNELNAWLLDCWEKLEVEKDAEHRIELQGRARAIREALNIIDMLIEHKAQEEAYGT